MGALYWYPRESSSLSAWFVTLGHSEDRSVEDSFGAAISRVKERRARS